MCPLQPNILSSDQVQLRVKILSSVGIFSSFQPVETTASEQNKQLTVAGLILVSLFEEEKAQPFPKQLCLTKHNYLSY